MIDNDIDLMNTINDMLKARGYGNPIDGIRKDKFGLYEWAIECSDNEFEWFPIYQASPAVEKYVRAFEENVRAFEEMGG